MNDTPEEIKALQLKIWLSKPPMERLRQMMKDNEDLMKFWREAKKLNGHTEKGNRSPSGPVNNS